MKGINVKISDEAYKIIFNYKIDKKLRTLDEVLDKIIKEYGKSNKRK